MVCVDNSEFTRNGDYAPTRFQAQADAVNLLAGAKTQHHPENTVGVMTMAGKTPQARRAAAAYVDRINSSCLWRSTAALPLVVQEILARPDVLSPLPSLATCRCRRCWSRPRPTWARCFQRCSRCASRARRGCPRRCRLRSSR